MDVVMLSAAPTESYLACNRLRGSTVPPSNERITENVVRDELRKLGYYKPTNRIRVEEQKSGVEAVRRLMRVASKSGGGGIGSPEFIVSSQGTSDFVMIIECKASHRDQISAACKSLIAGKEIDEDDDSYIKRVQRYAVDGALHYAQHLSRELNVIAIGVSGETKESAAVSVFLHPKGAVAPKPLTTKDGAAVNKLIPWPDFIEHATFDPSVQRSRAEDLMEFARELHIFMRNYAKLTESEKPLVVSGTLIALQNKAFAKSFDEYKPEDLQEEWLRFIRKEITDADIPHKKVPKMVQPYSNIAAHPELGKATEAYPKGILHELIRRLNEKVKPFISVYHDFDVVGQFYGEFLKYTGGDKKGLGIVLTPRHVTELFALIANVNKTSKVLDICAGTGGFLISAMHQMMKSAVSETEKDRIRKKGLVGVEQQPNMFALAASNMILRGDGKANLYQGSCFEVDTISEVKAHKCNVGMLNPPFSQSDPDLHELRFIKQMLDCLTKGGVGVALAPISCAIAPHPAKAEILKHHTLEAVMSMPNELFYPVGIVACVMVFTAKIPHESSDKKTWFGYWRDDGFIKTKQRGRIDLHHRWPAIRDRWVETFRNREVHPGECILQKVTSADEWCSEAYIETDYTKITRQDFERAVRNYAMFNLLGTAGHEGDDDEESE